MNKRILVIDDEEIVRICCERSLAPEGYDVVTAETGPEGLQKLWDAHFDLVITDLKMPEMDGLEVLAHIRKARPETKVIIVTGYDTEGTTNEIMDAGACGYLGKPFCPEDLMTAVHKTIGPAC